MNPLFETHILNETGIEKAREIAEIFDDALTKLAVLCEDDTREFSIVKTKLEEASFFAKKSMAEQWENQRRGDGESSES